MIQTKNIDYKDGATALEGYYAFDDALNANRPAIMVFHDWSGRNEFAEKKARLLAELGYIGFALDMYGEGKVAETNEEKSALMKPIVNDRKLLRQRALAAFEVVKTIPGVESARIGAIGFCFGGLCALDLARAGAEVKGVVSFHGLLNPPPMQNETIHASVLALHGHHDPMVTPENVLAFETEMTKANVDWQMHVYSKTQHAFMNPLAKDADLGLVYNPVVEKRAWGLMQSFFMEVL